MKSLVGLYPIADSDRALIEAWVKQNARGFESINSFQLAIPSALSSGSNKKVNIVAAAFDNSAAAEQFQTLVSELPALKNKCIFTGQMEQLTQERS